MIDELYINISIIVIGSLLFAFSFCLLVLRVSKSEMLKSYYTARYVMGGAYMFFGIANVVEYYFHSEEVHIPLTQMISLVIACSQAFLFTYTLITLVNIDFVTRKRFVWELIPILTFIIAAFICYSVCSGLWFKVFLYIFLLFYVSLLLRFTRMFLANYNNYKLRMDNYFSGQESERLRWVYFSFFIALAMGIAALFSVLFMSQLGSLLFSVAIFVFYIYFGIRFINYGKIFHEVEVAVVDEHTNKITTSSFFITAAESFPELEEKIKQWVADKKFTEKGITIDKLAAQLFTNRSYISLYINTIEHKTFRNWINDLRINEAKELLVHHPEWNLACIAIQVGFSDRSNFGRNFSKITGLTPDSWRKGEVRN